MISVVNATVCITWISLICSLQTSWAIKTDHCSHYQFERKFRNSIKCLLNNMDEMMGSGYGSQYCFNLYSLFPCFNDTEQILSCIGDANKVILENTIKHVLDEIVSPSLFPCPSQNLANIKGIDKIQFMSKNATTSRIIRSFVKFDKKMSYDEFEWDDLKYKNGTKINQMLKLFSIYGAYTLNRNERCIREKMFSLIVNRGFRFLDDLLLPCHVFIDINEECMNPNDFLSPRDAKLLRNLAITIYKQFMESILDLKHNEFVLKAYYRIFGYDGKSKNTDIENIRHDFKVNFY